MHRYVLALSVLGLLLMPALAHAQFEQGDWELTLSGSGSNNHDFDTGGFTTTGSLGYFFNENVEVGVRQGIIWADGGSSWSGDTRVFVDYHFDMDQWQPFVGLNTGYLYGDEFNDTWIAGPEVGVKYFLNSTTFIQAMMSYEFSLDESFDDGAFFYGLGIGVRL